MNSEVVQGNGVPFTIITLGLTDPDAVQVLWGHGWGQSGAAMMQMAQSLAGFASSIVIDFPGFGSSPLPPESWGTEDYADAIADWLKSQARHHRIWIGHSFGGRVGIQLAARHPDTIDGLILIASAGLKLRRGFAQQVRFTLRRRVFKLLRTLLPEGPLLEKVRAHFGSADYRKAGPLRPIFVRVVNEDLSEPAQRITCPVLLLYGEGDTETPVDIGRRLHSLIRGSKLVTLSGQDHYSIIGDGRHVTARHILNFIRGEA